MRKFAISLSIALFACTILTSCKNPSIAEAYYFIGCAYYDKKDYDRAISDFNEAIRLNPNLALAYNNRGLAYYAKKDYNRAIADYESALQIDPDNTDVRNNLEYLRDRLGRKAFTFKDRI